MPRVQRSLSAEDLYQRYRETSSHPEEIQGQNPPGIPASSPSKEIPGQQRETQAQNSAGISAFPPPSPPPPIPRDFEALRHRYRPISPQPVRQPLSPRLPDPPIFNGVDRSKFEDWKLKIIDKLTVNKDHYLTDASQIAYVITRLSGKAVEHTLPRRRKTTSNPYTSIDELLDQLSDLYEDPLYDTQRINGEAFRALKQDEQSFPEFYVKFMRYSSDLPYVLTEEDLMYDLKIRVTEYLRNLLDRCKGPLKLASLSDMKEYLTTLDHCHRVRAEIQTQVLAKKKARLFTEQYVKARLESACKEPGKYAILTRPDPEEYKR